MGIFKDRLKFKITKIQTHPTNPTGNVNQLNKEYKIDEPTIRKQQNEK
ncbi:hypothetical protein [Cellulophaga baltica]|nr:hypothetical protein [Cellulophaga baltica]